jgi:hypothetical protein
MADRASFGKPLTGFTGDILENTVPKKIRVKFSWTALYQTAALAAPESEKNIENIDAVMPIIYLDAVWLEVEYQKLGEDPYAPRGIEKEMLFSTRFRTKERLLF